jgi:hypothetical protein
VGQVNNGHGAPAPMEVGKGIEFRIFDQFDDRYLKDLVRFISLVAENSRVHQTKDYVYKNKHWIKMVQDVMKDGWCAKVSKQYLKLLRKTLGISIRNPPTYASDLLHAINEELYEKNRNGDWFIIMNGTTWIHSKTKHTDLLKPDIPDVNANSWMCGFCLKCNRHEPTKKKFYKLMEKLYTKDEITLDEFSEIIRKTMGKNWTKDTVNLCRIVRMLYDIELIYNKASEITHLRIKKAKSVRKIDFNDLILNFF